MKLPAVPTLYLDHSRPGGMLHGLRPVPTQQVAELATEYPGISTAYLAFVAEIGVGSCDAGNVFLPVAIEEIVDHQSYKLYRSAPWRRLLPSKPPQRFPLGALIVADTGASWKYCLGPDLGDAIYTFDLADGALDQSHASFESLIDEWLSTKPDNSQPTA